MSRVPALSTGGPRRWLAGLLCLGALAACRAPSPPTGDAPVDEVVARFGEHEITAAEVDARVLALPPPERPAPGEDLDAWYREQIRQLAIEHRLLTEAENARLSEEPTFATARFEAERQIGVPLCLVELQPDIERIDEPALRTAYDERIDAFTAPERRTVYHLFLRQRPEVSRTALREEIEELRRRVLRGESFRRLAAAHSDSERRLDEGSLGWVVPGQLPAGFEKVVFALEEGVPSEPVATRDGFHLFLVDQILPARRLDFAEARAALTEQLVVERRETMLQELEAGVEPPSDALLPTREDLEALIEAGDDDVPVLRLGDLDLTLGELRRQLRQAQRRQPSASPPTLDFAWRLVDGLRRRELVYRHCREQGAIPDDRLERALDDWQRQALIDLQRRRRLLAVAEEDEARLRLFYESEIGFFSHPPQWQLRLLRAPLGESPRAAMARLEAAAATSGDTLERLRDELGGEIEELGFLSLAELRRLEPKLPPRVAPLSPGELSAPYRSADRLEIAECVARREGEPLPFDEVRARVASAYVDQHAQRLYEELSAELLDRGELEILPDAVTRLIDAAAGRDEVTVEELEELLEGL